MEIDAIECELDDEESWEGTVKCPVCQAAWLEVREGGGFVEKPECRHLRFAIEPEAESIQCFNGFQILEWAGVIRPLLQQLEADVEVPAGELSEGFLTQFLLRHRFEPELWEAIESPAADTLLEYREEGLACGPVSMTALFGAKLGD